jgi:outer membrane protein assembly factor BamB
MIPIQLLMFIFCFACCCVRADDWPQWMGPQRDNVYRETGIIDDIPEAGLPVLWRVPIAGGYAGPAVAAGKVYVMDYETTGEATKNDPNSRSQRTGNERIHCFDMQTGKSLWMHEYPCEYNISYPGGPRCTPAIDGDRVYTLGAEGDLSCLDVASGKVRWSKQFPKDYGATVAQWGYASHPLVYHDLLICVVGGEGSIAVAFEKLTGQERWRSLSAKEQGYCPPTVIHVKGVDQLLIWDAEALHGLDPRTGKEFWKEPIEAAFGMAIAAPRQSGDLLFASAIGPAGGLYRLSASAERLETVWRCTPKIGVSCANSTPFLRDHVIYGTDCRSGGLRAVNMNDGAWLWETYLPTTGDHRAGNGTCFIVAHEHKYFLFSETGDLILAELSPQAYKELGRFHVLEPTSEAFGRSVVWCAPAFANRCCFVRNDKELVCVSLEETPKQP